MSRTLRAPFGVPASRVRRLAAAGTAAVVLLAACGDDGNDTAGTQTGDTATTTQSSSSTGDTTANGEAPGTTTAASTTTPASSTTTAGGSGAGSTTTTQAGGSTETTEPAGPVGAACTDVDAPALAGDTVAEAVTKIDALSTFAAAVEQSDAVSARLAGPRPITVLAPVDDAFAAMDQSTLDAAMADPAQLTRLLQGHILAGVSDGATVAAATEDAPLRTQAGTAITATAEGDDVVINGEAKVVCANITVANGVIHLIDAVIVPPAEDTTSTTAGG